jgi:mannose-6-phosphate isomerase-like protein (cupin superfamily)
VPGVWGTALASLPLADAGGALSHQGGQSKSKDHQKMKAFEVAHLIEQQNQSQQDYLEFLRVPSLSAGLYMLAAGAVDLQEPHTEDEVYFIISGRGFIQVEQESRPVEPGSTIFVNANIEHRFHTITEDLRILVIFAPAEYSAAQT